MAGEWFLGLCHAVAHGETAALPPASCHTYLCSEEQNVRQDAALAVPTGRKASGDSKPSPGRGRARRSQCLRSARSGLPPRH